MSTALQLRNPYLEAFLKYMQPPSEATFGLFGWEARTDWRHEDGFKGAKWHRLIGGAVLVGCVPTVGAYLDGISDTERAFGDYSPGRWAWKLDRATSIEPRPMRGALGLWPIPREELALS